jgi:hypothetical protein
VIIGQSAQTAIIGNILNNPSSGVWTDCSGYSSITVTITGVTPAAGNTGVIVFEGSQNASTALEIPVFRKDTQEGARFGSIACSDLNPNGSTSYDIPISFPFIRLRIVSILTNGIQATGTLKRNSIIPELDGDILYNGQPAQSAINTNILTPSVLGLSSIDCSGFKSGLIEIVPTGTITLGSYIFQGSNTQISGNFKAINVFDVDTGELFNGPINATSSRKNYVFPIEYRYIRLFLDTTIVGGSIQAFTRLKTSSFDNFQIISGGQSPHSSPSRGSPVRIGGKVLTTSFDNSLLENDTCDLSASTSGQLITIPHCSAESTWSFASTGGIVNNAIIQVRPTPATIGQRNYVKSIQLSHNTLSAATDFVILDGAGVVLWRTRLLTTALPSTTIVFDSPLRGNNTANSSISIQALTTVTGGIFANLQGYTSL